MSALALPHGLPRPASLRRLLRGTPISVLASLLVVVVVVLWALLPSLFTTADPVTAVPLDKLRSPSTAHWFGTDYFGRDELTRVIYGTRAAVLNAGVAVGIGLAVGGALGMLAGFFGGLVDSAIGRVVDTMLAIPGLLLAVAIVVTLGFHDVNAAVATGITSIAIFARIMRAEVLKVRQATFVEASHLQGGSRAFVLFAHVLPNAYRSVLALAILQLGNAILVIAALAFLGYGSPPPASSWGLLISDGSHYQVAPWLVYCPAAVVVLTVLSINRISRWLRTPK
jgi:peptide/nickel transport system permease protein